VMAEVFLLGEVLFDGGNVRSGGGVHSSRW
jgi:hypothetical protein